MSKEVDLNHEDMKVGKLYKNWCGEVRKLLHVLDDTFSPYVMSGYVDGYTAGKPNGEITGSRCFDLYDLNQCGYKVLETGI